MEVERGWQDGFDFRAVAVWRGDERPEPPIRQGPSAAYRSTLRLWFDEPADRPEPDQPL